MENLLLFILLALCAEILGTVGGFGSSLFFVPIASYFLDFYSVLGVTALFHVSSNVAKIIFFRKGFDKKLVIYMGIPAVLFVIAGALLSKYIGSELLELSLSIFLICISIFFLTFNKLVVKPSLTNLVSGGISSGLVAGLLGTGGAIRGIVLTAYSLKPEVFIATSAIIDLGIDISRSVVYSFNGYVHLHHLYLIPILLVVSVAGTAIGKILLKKISEQQFRSLVLGLVLLTGVFSLVKILMK